jgi:hypothetical protein
VSMSRTLGAVGALSVLVLTGCGAVQPGTAVEVGDDSIALSEVDEVASDFCSAIEPQLEAQPQSIPNSYLRGGIAGTLALRSVAEQVAAEYGVDADSQRYQEAVRELRTNVEPVPEEFRESVIEVESAPQYVEAIQAAVGEQELDGQGGYEEFVAAGSEVFTDWIAENGVEFDPALNTELKDGAISTVDGSVSFAVSEAARNGLAAEPNGALARQLPDAHRCGR